MRPTTGPLLVALLLAGCAGPTERLHAVTDLDLSWNITDASGAGLAFELHGLAADPIRVPEGSRAELATTDGDARHIVMRDAHGFRITLAITSPGCRAHVVAPGIDTTLEAPATQEVDLVRRDLGYSLGLSGACEGRLSLARS